MGPSPRAALALPLVILSLFASFASAVESGDFMCDARESTADTCVITALFVVADGTVLRFTRDHVRVRGSISTELAGRCEAAPETACSSDAGCTPSRCLRTGALVLEVRGTLDIAGSGQLLARGQAVAGDERGPNGGSITLGAHMLALTGTINTSAASIAGVPAGNGGHIVLAVTDAVTIETSARLDASTARGGCGGSITITAPATVALKGVVTVEGATRGGQIDVVAGDRTMISGTLQASNTDADLRTRPVCGEAPGGGTIRVRAREIELRGSARARGKEGAGGVIDFEAERTLIVDSTVGSTALSVSGGGFDAVQPGGLVTLTATAGDIAIRNGTLDADGQSGGQGSDAGAFIIKASGALRCLVGDTPCASAAACAPGDVCVERWGTIEIAAPLSAAGGAGAGFGCAACAIQGTGSVRVSGPIDVGGGRQFGGAGKLTITAGGDLTVGPGAIAASAADGGDVILLAGERTGTAANVGGALRIVSGTRVGALARDPDGAAGSIQVEGCDVTIEPGAVLDASLERGGGGESGRIEVTAREHLGVESLAVVRALPEGSVTLSHRAGASVAPDALVEPTGALVEDPALEPCPTCGNGVTDPSEECDGPDSCAGGQVCVPPGSAEACTCADTCGTIPGIQSGEECDGGDLGGRTCADLGFPGGVLACTPECTLDTSGCLTAVCGDGLVGPEEVCDVGGIGGAPPSFGGETCETLGFRGGGELTCTSDCGAVVAVPHCASTVAIACLDAAHCPDGEACVAGCVQCGNGFVDLGEECDDGIDNGSGPNRCRDDCRAPACGDATLDFPNCSGDPDVSCADDRDCPAAETCVAGERCDLGSALCLGGERNGEPCCRESDCPGGDCSGDGCEANRDDVPGCCRCSCTQEACGNGVTEEGEECDDGNRVGGDCCSPVCRYELAGGTCPDEGNPCTDDRCDGTGTCAHDPNALACDDGDACTTADVCREGACTGGAPVDCDDGDRCTADRCTADTGCVHEPIAECCHTVVDCFDGDICTVDRCDADGVCVNPSFGFIDARTALEASFVVDQCLGQDLPARFGRLLGKANAFLDRAAGASDVRRRDRFLTRARRRLRTAIRAAGAAGGRNVTGSCASNLANVVRSALERTACLRRASF
jgi:cysteine-rich repeat protein